MFYLITGRPRWSQMLCGSHPRASPSASRTTRRPRPAASAPAARSRHRTRPRGNAPAPPRRPRPAASEPAGASRLPAAERSLPSVVGAMAPSAKRGSPAAPEGKVEAAEASPTPSCPSATKMMPPGPSTKAAAEMPAVEGGAAAAPASNSKRGCATRVFLCSF